VSEPSHDHELADLGRLLFEAEAARRPIDQVSLGRPWVGEAEAYRIQQELVRRHLAAGHRIVGWKVGLTSEAMQRQLGVDQPDYGPILSGFLVEDGGSIAADALIAPRIEAEIAFILGAPLRGPGVTVADVLAATASVAPALEVIDSRIRDWKLTLADTVADLASSARVVVGPARPLDGLDLPGMRVRLERDGATVAEGVGSAALGDPAAAVAWSANKLAGFGVTMEAGHVVMPGALHASVPVVACNAFRAHFAGLGEVAVRFTASA
jgi:2-oxo-3-hexenedioate decarboxylase/2-keto-4-pentenoate hydratase